MKIDWTKGIELKVLTMQGDILLDVNSTWVDPTDLELWLNDYLKDLGNVHVFLTQGYYVHDFVGNY